MMGHLTDLELAQEAEERTSDYVREHLRWCSACRRAAAEYGWLEDELGRALKAEAGRARLPGPAWEAVHRRIRTPRHHVPPGRRAAALSLALMVSVMVLAPLVMVGGNWAWATAARLEDLTTAPAPAAVTVDEGEGTPPSSATAAGRHLQRVSLPFEPAPTPPEPQV